MFKNYKKRKQELARLAELAKMWAGIAEMTNDPVRRVKYQIRHRLTVRDYNKKKFWWSFKKKYDV